MAGRAGVLSTHVAGERKAVGGEIRDLRPDPCESLAFLALLEPARFRKTQGTLLLKTISDTEVPTRAKILGNSLLF